MIFNLECKGLSKINGEIGHIAYACGLTLHCAKKYFVSKEYRSQNYKTV